jgi:hypothetical protein
VTGSITKLLTEKYIIPSHVYVHSQLKVKKMHLYLLCHVSVYPHETTYEPLNGFSLHMILGRFKQIGEIYGSQANKYEDGGSKFL